MAFSTPNQQKNLINTDGYQYFGCGADGSEKTLSVNYLESNISIGIFSLLPQNQQTDKSRYDYKNGTIVYLRGKSAKTLYRLFKKAYDKVLEGESFESCAVPSGGNLIEVAPGEKFGQQGIALALYTKINEDKTSGEPAVYIFKNDNYVKNYNHTSGSFESGYIDSDIDYFLDQLHEFAKAINNASAHSVRRATHYTFNSIITKQLAICNKLGISFENNSKPYNQSNSNWHQGGGSVVNHSDAESLSEALNDIE